MSHAHAHTQGQIENFQEQYRRRRRRQLVLLVLILPVGAVLIVLKFVGIQLFGAIPTWLIWGGCALLIMCGLLFSYFNWRCPACEKYLGEGINPRICSKCGIPLHVK